MSPNASRAAAVGMVLGGALLLPLLPTNLLGQSAALKPAKADLSALEADLAKKTAELAELKAKFDAARVAAKKAQDEKTTIEFLNKSATRKVENLRTTEAKRGSIRIEIDLSKDVKADDVKALLELLAKFDKGSQVLKLLGPGTLAPKVIEALPPTAIKPGVLLPKSTAPATPLPALVIGQGETSKRIDAMEKKLDTILKELEAIRKGMAPAKSGKTTAGTAEKVNYGALTRPAVPTPPAPPAPPVAPLGR